MDRVPPFNISFDRIPVLYPHLSPSYPFLHNHSISSLVCPAISFQVVSFSSSFQPHTHHMLTPFQSTSPYLLRCFNNLHSSFDGCITHAVFSHNTTQPSQHPRLVTPNLCSNLIIGHVSVLYNSAGLTTVLYTCPFSLIGIFLSQSTPETFFQLLHPACMMLISPI